MRTPLALAAAVAVAVLGCARDTAPRSNAATFETIVTGLAVPWALAFSPDGRLFVTERRGRIRVVRDGQLEPEPWAKVNVVASGESGMMGIALSPDFTSDGRVYRPSRPPVWRFWMTMRMWALCAADS